MTMTPVALCKAISFTSVLGGLLGCPLVFEEISSTMSLGAVFLFSKSILSYQDSAFSGYFSYNILLVDRYGGLSSSTAISAAITLCCVPVCNTTIRDDAH